MWSSGSFSSRTSTIHHAGDIRYGGHTRVDAAGGITSTGLTPQALTAQVKQDVEALFNLERSSRATQPGQAKTVLAWANEARLLGEQVDRKLSQMDCNFDARAAAKHIAALRKQAEAICRGEAHAATGESARTGRGRASGREETGGANRRKFAVFPNLQDCREAPASQRQFDRVDMVVVKGALRIQRPADDGKAVPAFRNDNYSDTDTDTDSDSDDGAAAISYSATRSTTYAKQYSATYANGALVKESFKETISCAASVSTVPADPASARPRSKPAGGERPQVEPPARQPLPGPQAVGQELGDEWVVVDLPPPDEAPANESRQRQSRARRFLSRLVDGLRGSHADARPLTSALESSPARR